MANILFASNNPTHWGILATTSNLYFDSARVPYSITFNTVTDSPYFKLTTNNETWVHFRARGRHSNNSIVSGVEANVPIYQIYADDGTTILFEYQSVFESSNGTFRFYDGNGGVVTNGSWDPGQEATTPYTFDIRIRLTAFEMVYEVYINGSLTGSHTYGANVNSIAGVGFIRFNTGFIAYGDNGYISEFLVADASTLNARLNMLQPTAAGAYNQWAGNVTTLTDNNINTGLTTTAVDQRASLIMEAYTNPEIISNLVVVTQHLRGNNAPTKLRHFLRNGGVDYDATAAFTVGTDPVVSHTDYPINPSTSLPWANGDPANVEFGFKSEA